MADSSCKCMNELVGLTGVNLIFAHYLCPLFSKFVVNLINYKTGAIIIERQGQARDSWL